MAAPAVFFIGLALAAVAGVFLADFAPVPALGFAAMLSLGTIALARKSSSATYMFAAACFFSVHALHVVNAPGAALARELGTEPRAAALRGWVASEPKLSGRGMSSFLLRATSIERDGHVTPCRVTFSARWQGQVRYGDEVQIFGVLAPTAPPRNPGEFDMRAYLARRDVHTAFVSRYHESGHVLAHDRGNPVLRAAHASRRMLDAELARGLEDSPNEHALISGIVLGLRDETPDEIEEQFQQTGTIHLFAVAGLHVGMVAYLLWTIARVLRVPRRVAICLIVPALFFYAAITGLNTASLRAATMAAVVLGGALLERKALPGNSLAAAAVLLLLFDTQQLFTMGFQLSFAVVGTIIFLTDRAFHALLRWFQADPFLPASLLGPLRRFGLTSWRAIARGTSVSFAAWIGSLLLILPYFYLITPVSVIANLAVVPVAFFVMALGLLSLLASVAPSLALVFNYANGTFASAILWLVALFARAPAGHFYLGAPHWRSGAAVELTALDLGAGAAMHLRDRSRDWLIDCGAARDFQRVVRAYLRSRGVNHIDGLVLTHGDAAHIGAAEMIARVFRPREIIDTPAPDRSRSHRALIAEEFAPRRLCTAPAEVTLGRDVTARLLFPPNEFKASTADDQAMVLQLAIMNRWRVLLTSDSGEPTERLLLESGADLRSDLLVKGQHHSGEPTSLEFLDAVKPAAIIATSRDFPESERVKDDWAASVAARGIKLLRQDETGAVRVRFYRDHWEAAPFLRHETFRSTSR